MRGHSSTLAVVTTSIRPEIVTNPFLTSSTTLAAVISPSSSEIVTDPYVTASTTPADVTVSISSEILTDPLVTPSTTLFADFATTEDFSLETTVSPLFTESSNNSSVYRHHYNTLIIGVSLFGAVLVSQLDGVSPCWLPDFISMLIMSFSDPGCCGRPVVHVVQAC